MNKCPSISSFSEFKDLGFYDFLNLRACILKAMNSNLKLTSSMPESLPSRQSIVGLFHHDVMEMIFESQSLKDLEDKVEARIRLLQEQVDRWTHLKRSGAVSGWDEVNSSCLMVYRTFEGHTSHSRDLKTGVEIKLCSQDGMLKGRPDFFVVERDQAFLKELKSSDLRSASGDLRAEYLEQLLFYSALLFDSFKIKSVVAVLESVKGETYTMTITPQQAVEFKSKVVKALAAANKTISSTKDVDELAIPSLDSCQYCDKRILCARFKRQQFSLGLKADDFVLDGTLIGNAPSSSGKSNEVTVEDLFSNHRRSFLVPSEIASSLIIGARYLFSNLYERTGNLRWSDSSRIFAA